MSALLGKKKGMTQLFAGNGEMVPVTVVEAGPCAVVQRKTKSNDGYEAVQLGFEALRKPKGKKKAAFRYFREIFLDAGQDLKVGDLLKAEIFKVGEKIDVIGISKGKGFQGVMKRHGKAGGPATHGSRFHRTTGSIGQRTSPGEVFKNMKLPGHMGQERITVKNLEVVEVRDNLVFIKGAVPGAKEGLVMLRKG